jgi:hypothetical protein
MARTRAIARQRALYRALLLLYPRSFRAEYAEPMAQLFADRFREVGARAWLRTVPDLVQTASTERIEVVMNRLNSATRVLALAFIVIAAMVVAIAIGGGVVIVLALAVIAVLLTQRRLLTSSFGERAPIGRSVIQAWWAPVAALLGLATMLFAVGNFFEAHNLGGRIGGSAVTMAFGLAMYYGLTRRPFHRRAGNSMILLATIPAFALFWVIVPAVAAIIVWVGVLRSGFEELPVAPAATSPG